MVWMKRRQGEVVGDELTYRIKDQASSVAYLSLIVPIAILLVRDISADRSAGKGTMAALVASPFAWLLVIGLASWFGAMLYYGWRAGLYQGQVGGPVYLVLAVLVLLIGLLPVPWAAFAQLVTSFILIVAGAVWLMVARPAR
jgi:hypothetical protein